MEEEGRTPDRALRNQVADEISRRELISRATGLGLGALILSAAPLARGLATPGAARAADLPADPDGTLQAFFDTVIPGKRVPSLTTELGHPIHPDAIAGVDPEHGAVYTDALLLAHNPKLGFEALEPSFLADLNARALLQGGPFLSLEYAHRQATCMGGLDFANPTRQIWEAAAALPFTAFCAAANVKNANGRPDAKHNRAAGYRVMGHPGIAPHGYRHFSYRRRLAHGRTKRGNLP